MNRKTAQIVESGIKHLPFMDEGKVTAKSTEADAPVLPKFLEKKIKNDPATALAFNGPEVVESKVVAATRNRDFQLIEAFVAVTYKRPVDGIKRTRKVLASLRVGDDQTHANIRARLVAQAEANFVLMAKAGREAMFTPVSTH